MAEDETAVWAPLARQLREIAETVGATVAQTPLWTPESVAAGDAEREAEFSALPYDRPVNETLLVPPMLIRQALDHLFAFAAIVETPDTLMALFTVLRPLTVACCRAADVSDASVDTTERVRRAMNVHLESNGEVMNFLARDSAEYSEMAQRRERTVKAWRGMGHTAFLPSLKATSTHSGLAYLGNKPVSETFSLKAMFRETDGSMGASLYRLMSATTHAQVHAVTNLIVRDQAVPSGDDISTVPVAMSGTMMTMLALTAGIAFKVAIEAGAKLYGWPVIRWNTIVEPMLRSWLAGVNASPEARRQ